MNDEIKTEEIVEELEEVVELVEEEEEVVLPTSIEVGGVEYELHKTGADQAKQISDLLNWLGSYGEQLAGAVISEQDSEEALSALGSTMGLIASIGKVSSQQALLDLFVVVIGCTKKVANEYFSVMKLVDGVEVLLSQEEYAKVLNRFF